MKKIVGISLSIFIVMGAGVLFFGESKADAQLISNLFKGDWACSYSLEQGPTGEGLAMIGRTTINRDGSVVGKAFAVVAIPGPADFFLQSTSTGTATQESGGFITLELVTTAEGVTFNSKEKCVGMLQDAFNRFLKLQCIDLTVEPEGTQSVYKLECERQVLYTAIP